MISVELRNLEQVSAAISHIPGAVEKAVKASIKKTLTQSQREAVRLVKNRYTSPISIFKSTLKKNISGTQGTLQSIGSAIPLHKFQHSPNYRINSRGKYIKSVVVRGQGGILKRAFKMSDRPVLFEREGDARMPIKKMFSLSAPSMFSAVSEKVQTQSERFLAENFIQEVNKFL